MNNNIKFIHTEWRTRHSLTNFEDHFYECMPQLFFRPQKCVVSGPCVCCFDLKLYWSIHRTNCLYYSTRVDISGAFHLPDMQNSRYALKSGWPADRIWFSSWPAENIVYQLAVLENYSWQNVHISGWLAADFSPAGRFEEKYAAVSFR